MDKMKVKFTMDGIKARQNYITSQVKKGRISANEQKAQMDELESKYRYYKRMLNE